MRVNVDEQALNEPRIRRLARYVSQGGREINHHEALGRIMRVWMLCYQRRDAILTDEDIDIAAELDGFAAAMVRAELADVEPEASGNYIRGVVERIEFLQQQAEKGRKSGEKRRQAVANRIAYVNQKRTEAQQRFGFGGTAVEPTPGARLNREDQSVRTYSLAPDLDQAPDQAPDHVPPPGDGDEAGPGAIRQDLHAEPPRNAQERAERVGGSQTPGGGSEAPQGKTARSTRELPDQAVTLAHLLLGQISTNHPSGRLAKAPERVQHETALRWAATIDKLHRLDKFSWGEIEGMIVWSQRDSFWRGVILGADNLRDKWDKMAAQRERPKHPNAPSAQRGPTALALEDQRRLEREEREGAAT